MTKASSSSKTPNKNSAVSVPSPAPEVEAEVEASSEVNPTHQATSNSIAPEPAPDPELKERLESAKRDLVQTLAKKRKLDKELASLEATLYAHETNYLTHPTANSFGNIVKGYEAYVKAPPSVNIGGNGASSSLSEHHSTRRKRVTTAAAFALPSQHSEIVGDAERVFSKSSGSYLRALESRNRDHDSAITSEQESVAQSLLQGQTNLPGSLGPESRKKVKS